MLKLFNFLHLSFNYLSFNSHSFIKVYNTNKLDKEFSFNLIREYSNNFLIDLFIFTNNYKYTFGTTLNCLIENTTWSAAYLKVIVDYVDTFNECLSIDQEVNAFHKIWKINNNLVNAWISASNKNVFNLFTSLTNLNQSGYVTVYFKYFKPIKLYSGDSITFPSTFQYSYKIECTNQEDTFILFSQASLKYPPLEQS